MHFWLVKEKSRSNRSYFLAARNVFVCANCNFFVIPIVKKKKKKKNKNKVNKILNILFIRRPAPDQIKAHVRLNAKWKLLRQLSFFYDLLPLICRSPMCFGC